MESLGLIDHTVKATRSSAHDYAYPLVVPLPMPLWIAEQVRALGMKAVIH